MNLIKLSATSSTNDYLKKLSLQQDIQDFTVVWALQQTNGKGQMGTNWVTKATNNLTFSMLLKGDYVTLNNLFTLNIIVANSVLKALRALNLTNIYVKWPNDILSYDKKIGGILIENTITSHQKIKSIVGIGINIEETNFDLLPQASSIKNNYGISVDKESLLKRIVDEIKKSVYSIEVLIDNEWQFYHNNLYKKDVLSDFLHKDGFEFKGIIRKVNRVGQLEVELPNNEYGVYNLKDVKLIY